VVKSLRGVLGRGILILHFSTFASQSNRPGGFFAWRLPVAAGRATTRRQLARTFQEGRRVLNAGSSRSRSCLERQGNEQVPDEGDCANFCAPRTRNSCAARGFRTRRQVQDDRWEGG
jgi:hypothetical protein